jgi:hypothetical protein
VFCYVPKNQNSQIVAFYLYIVNIDIATRYSLAKASRKQKMANGHGTMTGPPKPQMKLLKIIISCDFEVKKILSRTLL